MPSHWLTRPDPTPSDTARAAAQARFWNRLARRYASSKIADMAGYEATLQRVQGLLSPDHSVLEIGCGTGTTALRLAAGTRCLLATDVSPAMIAIAREKLAAQPLPQLHFGVVDAEAAAAAAAPAGPAPHDVILAFNVLHLMSNLDATLRGLLPLLKPGGLFISKTPCLAEMNPIIPRVLVPLMRAIGLAPAVLSFDAVHLQSTLQRHGLVLEAVERHGSRRKDVRIFIVARKPR